MNLILIRAADYKELSYSEIPNRFDANNMARMVLSFENSIFGTDEFLITDPQLKLNSMLANGKVINHIAIHSVYRQGKPTWDPNGFPEPGYDAPTGCSWWANFEDDIENNHSYNKGIGS